MPRGFDAPSGADLPDKLFFLAPNILAVLKTGRTNGAITPERQITGAKLGEPFKLSDVEVRAIVSYWRSMGEPIGSTAKGYFYARSAGELGSTFDHLRDRAERIQAVIRGLERAVERFADGAPEPTLFS